MISPALRSTTRLPTRMSFSVMKSWLCKVARLTVVPANVTGANTPVGVRTPVRPTFTSISSNVVSFSSGGYLKASAHRGNLAVLPSSSRWEKSLTFTTAPSMGKENSPRLPPISSMKPSTSSMLEEVRYRSATGKPSSRSHSRDWSWRESSLPSTCWTLNTNRLNSRWAVILGSFWRREPAAALRGFLKGFSSKSSWRSHRRAKLSSDMYTSPRTSKKGTGSLSTLGTQRMVRMFSVTSSPVTPSPRVEPRTNRPSRYSSATESPSNLGSTTYSTSPTASRTRRSNSRSSSWEKES